MKLALFRRFSASLLAVSLSMGAVLSAQPSAAATAPDAVIRSETDDLQADIGKNFSKYSTDKTSFYAMVDKRIDEYFDTTYIAQLILARNWATATPDQRKRFEIAFTNMLIHTYADALLQYHDNVKTEVKAASVGDDASKATVNTTLLRKDGPPIPLSFDMRLKDDAWKVYDIKVENISLVGNFRAQINAQIKQTSLDAVIAKLEGGEQVIAPVKAGESGPAGASK